MPDQSAENAARLQIDAMLQSAGWILQDPKDINVQAGRGVVIRYFRLKHPFGEADYVLFIDGIAAGIVEAKPEGTTLTGVEAQTDKYSKGLPDSLPAYLRPLPFLYQSTGVETRFTNKLDPEPRSRQVFHFHRPETLADWLQEAGLRGAVPSSMVTGGLLRARLKNMPPMEIRGLWPAQIEAIRNLELSLAADRPRALIQMASGSGKTFTACNFIYRLIHYGGARRVLFLVDRANLGRQALKEFQQFRTPDDGRKFTELYNVQHLQSNHIDPVARVCITTIQRLFSMLKGEPDLDPVVEEPSAFQFPPLYKESVPVEYNPNIPIEMFDIIVTDECHRSIYQLWRQVLEYYDASIIGLTATPSKQTLGFFNQNLVMSYTHEQAVADGVNVDFQVYRIRTKITEQGSKVEAGLWVDKRNRMTRRVRWEALDDDLVYQPSQLDNDIVAMDQIRTVIRTFRDRLFTDIFPGRTEVPKTLVFAKDDSHADDIVQVVREEFGRGNEFAVKITYRTTGVKPETLIQEFRNSYNPRIAVTVDMIATGTDIRPVECVFFMRDVKSRVLFEQMKGRGARVISETDLQGVTLDTKYKTQFIIVDAVGVTERELADSISLDRQPSVSLERLLHSIALGNRDPDAISSLASRLARLDRQFSNEDKQALAQLAGGVELRQISRGLVDALDPDIQLEAAKKATGLESPPTPEIEKVAQQLINKALEPVVTKPAFRNRLVDLKKEYEQTIDTVSTDEVLAAGYSEAARERARKTIQSWEQFIQDNRDEITALQVLYSRPYRQRLTFKEIKELAAAVKSPPRSLTPEALWQAYELLEKSKVRGSGKRVLTDLVSLVRFALKQEDELVPFEDTVKDRFESWMARQEAAGRSFSAEQRRWLELIRDHVATSMSMEMEDFELSPFNQIGGLGRASQVFGQNLQKVVEDLNGALIQ